MRRRFIYESFNPENYLTITALEDNFSISFTEGVSYSVNKGVWLYLLPGVSTPLINTNDFICFKKNTESGTTAGRFISHRPFSVSGNSLSMIYGDNARGKYDLNGASLADLFNGCTYLQEVSEDFLPAKDLTEECYQQMFLNCKDLKRGPALPASKLETDCYLYMFCGCSSLNYIKMLATDISASRCLFNWVSGVASSGTFVKNPDATWEVYGDNGIPNGWTVKMDGEEDSGSLIEFTVKNTFFGEISTYQAKEGMTWTEWVNSSYNTDGYFLELNEGNGRYKIVSSDKMWSIVSGGAAVWGDETIINNNEYQLDFY